MTRSSKDGERGDTDELDDEKEGKILDSVIQLTEYNRSYAVRPACCRQGPSAACKNLHCRSRDR